MVTGIETAYVEADEPAPASPVRTVVHAEESPCSGTEAQKGRPRTFTIPFWLARSHGVIALVLLFPIGTAVAFSPIHYAIDSWGQYICQCAGWLLFLGGATLRWWAMLYIGGRKAKVLVTQGPYSLTRNPLYIGTFALTLAIGVLLQSVTFSLAVVLAAMVYLGLTLPTEEQGLRSVHGAQFEAYYRRVPRFLPKPSQFHSPQTIVVHVIHLKLEFIRACRWALIPGACELFTHLRAESWWPIWFRLP